MTINLPGVIASGIKIIGSTTSLGGERLGMRARGRVALRTRRSLLPQIVDRAKREHPYEVPSVVAVPIIDGGPEYLRWVVEQTEAGTASGPMRERQP